MWLENICEFYTKNREKNQNVSGKKGMHLYTYYCRVLKKKMET